MWAITGINHRSLKKGRILWEHEETVPFSEMIRSTPKERGLKEQLRKHNWRKRKAERIQTILKQFIG